MMVTPVKVEGTRIVHLATTTLDELGGDYRVICPGGPLITRALQLVAAGETFVWCPACSSWAAAAGIPLPAPHRTASM